MALKQSIECWIISKSKEVLLLTVPEKLQKNPAFNQPITGGIEYNETPEVACVREILEETCKKISANDLVRITDSFEVTINDSLSINKTVFIIVLDMFIPILNSREHSNFLWVQWDCVEELLFYKSNIHTWSLVNSYLNEFPIK